MPIETYKGNPNLKSAQVRQEYTQEHIQEFMAGAADPVYFIEQHVNIVSIDEGLVPFKMYPFQQEIVKSFHSNRFTNGDITLADPYILQDDFEVDQDGYLISSFESGKVPNPEWVGWLMGFPVNLFK